jgi:hypothetical protein
MGSVTVVILDIVRTATGKSLCRAEICIGVGKTCSNRSRSCVLALLEAGSIDTPSAGEIFGLCICQAHAGKEQGTQV